MTDVSRWNRIPVLAFSPYGGAWLDNLLAMQALAARLRAQAAETSLDFFRRKFEAAAEELEQWAGLPKRPGAPRFPDKENGPGCGH